MICLISATNRPGSNTRKITNLVRGCYDRHQVPVHVLDLQELPAELFHPSSYGQKPDAFESFSSVVVKSDGLHFVLQEYNGGFPGVLKYFLDMLPFPEAFEGKPVAFTGLAAGMWGALRPVEQLEQIYKYRNAHLFPERVFLPKVNSLLNEEGTLPSELMERLESQAMGFHRFCGLISPEG